MQRGTGYNGLIEQFIEQKYQEERLSPDLESSTGLMPENAIVHTDIVERDGCWIVYLVFIDMHDPCCFVRVPARVCRRREIAEIVASYKCKLCSCGACLPLTVGVEDFGLSDN